MREDRGRVRPDLQRLRDQRQRLVVAALLEPQHAQVVTGFEMLGPRLEDRPVQRVRFVQAALLVEGGGLLQRRVDVGRALPARRVIHHRGLAFALRAGGGLTTSDDRAAGAQRASASAQTACKLARVRASNLPQGRPVDNGTPATRPHRARPDRRDRRLQGGRAHAAPGQGRHRRRRRHDRRRHPLHHADDAAGAVREARADRPLGLRRRQRHGAHRPLPRRRRDRRGARLGRFPGQGRARPRRRPAVDACAARATARCSSRRR